VEVPSLAEVDLTDLVERWIYERLHADLDPPVNDRITKGPPGLMEHPCAKFSYQSDVVTRGVGLDSFYFTTYLYAVRGVDIGTATDTVAPIAAGIYGALADKLNDETVTGLVVLASTFFSHFRLEHDEGNERYIELGGIYQISAQLKE
jgi:hypothetical protein